MWNGRLHFPIEMLLHMSWLLLGTGFDFCLGTIELFFFGTRLLQLHAHVGAHHTHYMCWLNLACLSYMLAGQLTKLKLTPFTPTVLGWNGSALLNGKGRWAQCRVHR